jgi:conjugative relaxase-like TrwC/TraI family protein
VTLRVNAGHDPEYPLRAAGSAAGYYLQDGKEPPGQWAGTGAAALGLTGQVDPDTYRALFGKLVTPAGEKLYTGRPPRYVTGEGKADDGDAVAGAVAALGPFTTPAEERRTRAKVLGATGAAVPFYDLTFSATKSPSLLQASYAAAALSARAAGDHDQAAGYERRVRAIDEAALEAARQVVALAERRALFVRTGHHGRHSGEFRDAGGAVAALFPQHDNRSGEPNLHVHIVLLNRAVRADHQTSGDGKWRALYGRALWKEQLGLAAEAERIFARLLQVQGIPMVQQESGNAFEAGGVEQATMDAFSARTRGQIDPELAAEAAEYERTQGRSPSARTVWEWRQHIARSTRRAKLADPPAGPERLAAWEQHSRNAGVQILGDLHQAVRVYTATHAPPAELMAEQRVRTVRIAVREVQARHAAFTASQLLWELHRALPVLPTGTDPVPLLESMAADALSGRIEDVDIVLLNPAPGGLDVDHLGVRASDGYSIYRAPCENKYASVGQFNAEQHILAQTAQPRPRLVHRERAEAAAAGQQLSQEQAGVLQALLTSDKAMTVVRAAAGTGKTRLAAAFARAWAEMAGGLVHVVTVSENAARVATAEMEAAGAPALSCNLARFLGKTPDGTTVNPVQVGPRDVVILDEAGQVDTADLLKLQAAAGQAGARVVAVGDEYQLGAINAGGMFPLLADRLGALKLHQIHRFAEQWEKDASLKLRQGDVTAAADYQARGRIHAAPQDQAQQDMVLDWAADIRAGHDALMIAQTEAEVAELNRQAAAHLAKARQAAGWRPGPERVRLSDGNRAQVGDWIQARLNDHMIGAGGQWLANRDILQITRIYGHGHDRQVEARRRLPDGTWTSKFTIPARYTEQSATLGYASTVYAAQGRTVDVAHALITAGMNREALYVAATRGRAENRLHVVTGTDRAQRQADPEAVLGQALASPASEQSATAELDAAMDANDHPAWLLYLYEQITADQRGQQLDEELRARLDPRDFARYLNDPVRPVLHRAIRQAQLAGHDTAAVLDQITRGSMDRARTVASVLHGRLQQLSLAEQPQSPSWTQRLPEARTPGPARQAAQMMDARTQAIGEQLAARPEPWLVDRLGMPPQQHGALRDDWISRAGRAGFYRQAHGITYPHVAIGEMPANDPDLLMLWEQAHRDLEIPADEAGIRAKSRAELEGTVRAHTRAAETAPPDVARKLGYHRRQAATLQRQAEQAEADGGVQLASDSRVAAAEEVRQAAELSAAQEARDAWDRDHDAQRLAARAALQELDRRGIQAEPEFRDSENLTDWWRQFEAAAEAADRPIGRQRQAAIDAGEPWPQRPGRAVETGGRRAGAQAGLVRLQHDGYLPGLNLHENERQAETPEADEPQPQLAMGSGPKTDLGQRIDVSIQRVQQAGARMAADLDAEQQARQDYAARIAREAKYEAQAAYASPTDGTPAQAEVDYELEV